MLDLHDFRGWTILAYCVCVGVQTIFAVVAIVYAKAFCSNMFKTIGPSADDLITSDGSITGKGFLTARKTQNGWRIAWSFFGTAMGARSVTFPAFYASKAGWLGLLLYALSCGVPIIIIALIGPSLQIRCPRACSLGDFVLYRFGPCARLLVSCVVIFNMGLAMLAEFMTVGALFQIFVGNYSYPIISTAAFLTVVYTAYGGLATSIATHQGQTWLSLALILLLTIYVAVTFRQSLPSNFGARNFELAPNYYGFSSLYIWPCSLMATTVFSDAIWQRVWAAESASALRFGGVLGGVIIIMGIYLLGFAGFLASWAGLTHIESTNQILYTFQVFIGTSSDYWANGANSTDWGPAYDGPSTISNWMSALLLILAIVLNQAYISAIMNGLASTIITFFMNGRKTFVSASGTQWSRLSILLFTIPTLIISYQAYVVMPIILISNLVCSCCFIPVLLGFWDTDLGRIFISETAVLFSICTSMLTVSAYVIGRYKWNSDDVNNSIDYGFQQAWMENFNTTDHAMSIPQYLFPDKGWAQAGHPWDIYIVASGSSVVALLVFMSIAAALRRCGCGGIGVSRILGCFCPASFYDVEDPGQEMQEQETIADKQMPTALEPIPSEPISTGFQQLPDTYSPKPVSYMQHEEAAQVEPAPRPAADPHDVGGQVPHQQVMTHGQSPAGQPPSWTPALPWTPADVRPHTPTVRSNLEALHGGPSHNISYGDEYHSGGGNSSFQSYPNDGHYKAYHPASITLDVEGDIGDA